MSQFALQITVSILMALLCVMIHGVGLFSLGGALRSEATAERLQNVDPLSPRGAAFTLLIVLAMFLLHGLEIFAFAMVFWQIGAVTGFEDAVYYSTISYSTVGYHDTHMSTDWRMLGAIESVLGIFLLGWSTAFFFLMLGRIRAH
jgi:uncharacterized protein YhhL (DUF1145 family)